MKRFRSTLCASLLTVALASTAFAGTITTKPGSITTKPGSITTGNITAGSITTFSVAEYLAIMLASLIG